MHNNIGKSEIGLVHLGDAVRINKSELRLHWRTNLWNREPLIDDVGSYFHVNEAGADFLVVLKLEMMASLRREDTRDCLALDVAFPRLTSVFSPRWKRKVP